MGTDYAPNPCHCTERIKSKFGKSERPRREQVLFLELNGKYDEWFSRLFEVMKEGLSHSNIVHEL